MTGLARRLDVDDERQDRDPDAARRRAEFVVATEGLGLPEGYQLPEGYEVTARGVRQQTRTGSWASAASAPVLVTRVYVDPEGHESVEVTWRGRNGWVRRIVARSAVSSGKKLVDALANCGLPVIASDGARAERWLSAVERCNRRVIEVEVLARWLGWQPDGRFLCGPDDGRKVEPGIPALQSDALAAHRQAGTFPGWRGAVAVLEKFPVATMVVAAALAAPLLTPLGLDSFMVDVFGRSTRGKTTTARVVGSVWGEPSAGGLLFSWQTTLSPAEARLNLVRGLPVVFDETQLVTKPEVVHKIVYSLEKGRSQTRSGGYQSGLAFQAVLVSTGEKSVLDFTKEQGAAARVLSLARPPLPAGDGHGQLAAALSEGVRTNYGHAGPAFIARLVQEIDRPEGRERLRSAHATICTELVVGVPPEADITRRRVPHLAALILAARLAHEWGVLPVTAPPLEQWAEVFQAGRETDDRAEMALEVVRSHLAAHPGVIQGLQGGNRVSRGREAPPGGWLGRMVDVDGARAVALLPDRLSRILADGEYDLAAVRTMWLDLGIILPSQEGTRARDTQKHRMPGTGASPRFLVFDPKHLDLNSDEE